VRITWAATGRTRRPTGATERLLVAAAALLALRLLLTVRPLLRAA
jgi:hypothetical protein